MESNNQKDQIEWHDPYADFNKKTEGSQSAATIDEKNKKQQSDSASKVAYNEDTPTYTAVEIYHYINGTNENKKPFVSVSASLSVVDKNNMDQSISKGEIAFGNATVDLQRREDTIQLKIEPPVVDSSDAKTFWKLLEEYGETTEKLYEDENKLVLLFVYIIPQDKPFMFMNITNPLFWALQNSNYEGGRQQIRILVPTQMVEFSISNVDQAILEKSVDAEIDAETNRLIQESTLLEKEIKNLEEQVVTEEMMQELSDKENENSDEDLDDE